MQLWFIQSEQLIQFISIQIIIGFMMKVKKGAFQEKNIDLGGMAIR